MTTRRTDIDLDNMEQREQVARRSREVMGQGYSCAEAVVLAVGEYLLGEVDGSVRRASTAFGGGLGGSMEDICGALSGGAMIMSAIYGRVQLDEDRIKSRNLAMRFRERFVAEFGTTSCKELRERGYGSDAKPCALLVEIATRQLLETLAKEEKAQ
jgi:C_GCAxxG_C_C family probable redox protein